MSIVIPGRLETQNGLLVLGFELAGAALLSDNGTAKTEAFLQMAGSVGARLRAATRPGLSQQPVQQPVPG